MHKEKEKNGADPKSLVPTVKKAHDKLIARCH